jgi:hypothetical protein
MINNILNILSVIVGIAFGVGLLVLVASFLERRAKKGGNLFSKPPTKSTRILAVVFALFFIAVTFAEIYFTNAITFIFPLISIALFVYAFWGHRFLSSKQITSNNDGSMVELPPKK